MQTLLYFGSCLLFEEVGKMFRLTNVIAIHRNNDPENLKRRHGTILEKHRNNDPENLKRRHGQS